MSSEDARCVFCSTMHDFAQLIHAKLTRGSIDRHDRRVSVGDRALSGAVHPWRLVPDPYLARFDHPEAIRNGFRRCQRQRAPKQFDEHADALYVRAHNPYARMARRRIGADVPEVQVERDQHAGFVAAHAQDPLIGSAAESLVDGGTDIVASVTQQRDRLARDVFVQLEAQRHAGRLGGNWNDALARQVRSVREGRRDVRGNQRRIVGQDPLRRLSGREIVENDRHRYAGAAKAHSPVHDLRIGGDVGFPVHGVSNPHDCAI